LVPARYEVLCPQSEFSAPRCRLWPGKRRAAFVEDPRPFLLLRTEHIDHRSYTSDFNDPVKKRTASSCSCAVLCFISEKIVVQQLSSAPGEPRPSLRRCQESRTRWHVRRMGPGEPTAARWQSEPRPSCIRHQG